MTAEPKEELIADAEHILRKIKDDKNLWNGQVGLSPHHRDSINDWLREHQKVASC
jgi:hypothetical protein